MLLAIFPLDFIELIVPCRRLKIKLTKIFQTMSTPLLINCTIVIQHSIIIDTRVKVAQILQTRTVELSVVPYKVNIRISEQILQSLPYLIATLRNPFATACTLNRDIIQGIASIFIGCKAYGQKFIILPLNATRLDIDPDVSPLGNFTHSIDHLKNIFKSTGFIQIQILPIIFRSTKLRMCEGLNCLNSFIQDKHIGLNVIQWRNYQRISCPDNTKPGKLIMGRFDLFIV